MPSSESSYWHLLREMTRTDFKLRDQGTALGFLWTLLHPALMFTVLYLLFTKWMGKFVDNYAPYLIIGIVQYQFFEKTTNYTLSSLKRKSGLVKNFKFPKEIIVLSGVGCHLWSYLLEMAMLLLLLVAVGIRPTWAWLLLPVAMAALALFVLGVSMVLSILAVEYQDLERVWGILTTAGFYLTPIFYPLSVLGESRQKLLMANPMMHLIDGFRYCLIGWQDFHLTGFTAVVLGGMVLTALGWQLLYRYDAHITDRILEP